MKFLGLLLACVVAMHAAHPQKLKFDGTLYEQAFHNLAKDGTVTVEYVPTGEKLEHWTSLIAFREWPHKDQLAVVNAWLSMVGPLLVQKPVFMKSNAEAGKEEIIVDAWLRQKNGDYTEINLYRFMPPVEGGGVRAIQFATKIRDKSKTEDLKNFLIKRADYIAALTGAGTRRTVATIESELEKAEKELAELRSRYKEGYIGIRKKLEAIESLKAELGTISANP